MGPVGNVGGQSFRYQRLADLDATALERWLLDRKAEGMIAGTMNQYRSAWVAFGNWCACNGRLLVNLFSVLPKADESAARRRTRRALKHNGQVGVEKTFWQCHS